MAYMLTFLFSLGFSSGLFAQGHLGGDGHIVGGDIDLQYEKFAFRGTVGGYEVRATPLPNNQFGVNLNYSVDGKSYGGSVKYEARKVTGSIASARGKVRFEVTGTNADLKTVSGILDGETFVVKISEEAMDDYFYVNPTYSWKYNGKKYEFKLEGGKACLGCSQKIIFVVLGMMRASGSM